MTYTFNSFDCPLDPDENVYEDHVENGQKIGRDTFIYSDGRNYVGQFKDGKFYGQSVMT